MSKRVVRNKRPCGNTACAVNLQDIALFRLLNAARYAETQPFRRFSQNFLSGCVEQESLIMINAKRVIALYNPDCVLCVQHRKHKRALDGFRHAFQAGEVEGFLFFYQLYGNIAIGLDIGFWQLALQRRVVPENPVVCERKGSACTAVEKRLVIVVLLFAALCCHTGMPHHGIYPIRHAQLQPVCGQRAFINSQSAAKIIGDSSRIRAPALTFTGERVEDTVLLLCA